MGSSTSAGPTIQDTPPAVLYPSYGTLPGLEAAATTVVSRLAVPASAPAVLGAHLFSTAQSVTPGAGPSANVGSEAGQTRAHQTESPPAAINYFVAGQASEAWRQPSPAAGMADSVALGAAGHSQPAANHWQVGQPSPSAAGASQPPAGNNFVPGAGSGSEACRSGPPAAGYSGAEAWRQPSPAASMAGSVAPGAAGHSQPAACNYFVPGPSPAAGAAPASHSQPPAGAGTFFMGSGVGSVGSVGSGGPDGAPAVDPWADPERVLFGRPGTADYLDITVAQDHSSMSC